MKNMKKFTKLYHHGEGVKVYVYNHLFFSKPDFLPHAISRRLLFFSNYRIIKLSHYHIPLL
jgi:uncharacterized membrane protein